VDQPLRRKVFVHILPVVVCVFRVERETLVVAVGKGELIKGVKTPVAKESSGLVYKLPRQEHPCCHIMFVLEHLHTGARLEHYYDVTLVEDVAGRVDVYKLVLVIFCEHCELFTKGCGVVIFALIRLSTEFSHHICIGPSHIVWNFWEIVELWQPVLTVVEVG